MRFDEKIDKILEGLHQFAIGEIQQRANNKNYGKYTPKPSKNSYTKGNLPTVQAAKYNGMFHSNGISDEETKKKKKLKKKKKSL